MDSGFTSEPVKIACLTINVIMSIFMTHISLRKLMGLLLHMRLF